ncbi:MAG: hypothetical protein IH624_09370 [Phycisphaerae bacterium]|nr:hypothetical protein [Phycisphaerae bacterium]
MQYIVPPLISGGIMLSYQCTNACRHCLYRCRPDKSPWMSNEMIDRVFSALADESCLQGVHLAGGEATMRMDVLIEAIDSAVRHNVPMDYLETNCAWCLDEQTARKGFEQLRQRGLGAVLISASLFHNEFIPFERTRIGISVAGEVFGGNVIVWTPEGYRALSRLGNEDRTHTLAESCKILGLDDADLWRLHSYVRPSGRAAEILRAGLPKYEIEHFVNDNCSGMLSSVTHFHIDPNGFLYTGGCPGITVGNVRDGLHPRITPDRFGVFCRLFDSGPCGLLQMDEYKPRLAGYVSKCDLCLDIRKQLRRTGKFPELEPHEFYA